MLNSDYNDMLRALSGANVKFLVVGGYALSAHGYPRTTLDIDIWVWAEQENAQALIRALRIFGAPLSGVTENDFAQEGIIFQIGVAPRRIDIITSIDGVSFNDAYPRSILVDWDGIEVRVLSLQDLIANKQASGRLKDLADVEMLEKLHNYRE